MKRENVISSWNTGGDDGGPLEGPLSPFFCSLCGEGGDAPSVAEQLLCPKCNTLTIRQRDDDGRQLVLPFVMALEAR